LVHNRNLGHLMRYLLAILFFALIAGCAEPPIRADLTPPKRPEPPIVLAHDVQFRSGKSDMKLLAGTYYAYMENAAGKFYICEAPCVLSTHLPKEVLMPVYFAWTGGVWIPTNQSDRPQLWYRTPSVRGDTWEEFSARRAEVAATLMKRDPNVDATNVSMSITLPVVVANPTAGNVVGGAVAAGIVGLLVDMSIPLPLGVSDNQQFDDLMRQTFRPR
jgi:hypothetical protein